MSTPEKAPIRPASPTSRNPSPARSSTPARTRVRKGWTVDDEHVYVDDGISGAEFANRPGFLRLMNALKPRPPFQVLVMSRGVRLGREAIETAYALKQLIAAGVRVFSISRTGSSRSTRPIDKPARAVQLRRRTGTREGAAACHTTRWSAGARRLRSGGRVRLRQHRDHQSDGRRSHVERRINTREAEIVCGIFQRCAAGQGVKAIAKALNAAGGGDAAARPRAAPSAGRRVQSAASCSGGRTWVSCGTA